ncbi:hypothetical protein MATR_01600 [Marivirga tractuosa]|nr:glycosyltransferase family A protein [Marivirga tractuosa]BDD13335.1 hypothetical protein MATR_01600 [Marivirga tractuosa]
MPVYNAERYLEQAIQSLINQTFQNWKLHVCDDASHDNSWELIKRFEKLDSRIQIYRNEANKGKVKTVNDLLKYCNSKYLTVHDADDWSEPDRFEYQVSFLEGNHDFYLCGTSFYEHNRRNKEIIHQPTNYSLIKEKLPKTSQFHGPTIVFKQEIINEIGGFYRYFKWGEDIDFCARVVEKYKATNIDRPLYNYRVHANSLTNNINQLSLERFIGPKIRIFLANQRITEGSDFLMRGEDYLLEKYVDKLLSNVNYGQVYREFSNYLYHKGFKRKAILAALKSIINTPSFSNFKNLLVLSIK